MPFQHIPYNPANDPYAYLGQALAGAGSGLGKYLGKQQQQKEVGQDIKSLMGGDYTNLQNPYVQAQVAQAMVGRLFQKPMTPLERAQTLKALAEAQNVGKPLPLNPLQEAQMEQTQVETKQIGKETPLQKAQREKLIAETGQIGTLNPLEQAQMAKTIAETGQIGRLTPLEQANMAKILAETKQIGKLDPLQQAQLRKVVAETEQIGKPNPMSQEQQKNLVADTELKLAQAKKAAMDSGTDKLTRDRALTNTLRGDYDSLSKDYRTIRDSYNRLLAAASDPSAAGDLAIIFNYMKILDPTSVVRESEFATAENAAGVPIAVRNLWNKALTGERLAWNREDFVKTAKGQFQAKETTQKQLAQRYKALAKREGLNPDDIILYGPSTEVEDLYKRARGE